jgi:hypothetical protein
MFQDPFASLGSVNDAFLLNANIRQCLAPDVKAMHLVDASTS